MAREIEPFSGYFDFGMPPIHPEESTAVERIKEKLDPGLVALWTTNGQWEKQFPNYGPNATAKTADAFRNSGIRAASWGAVYGSNPQKEGEMAATKANELEAEFHAFDVEGQFESVYAAAQALLYDNPIAIRAALESIRAGATKADLLIGAYRDNTDIAAVFCSFAWPYSYTDPTKIWHKPAMYKDFLGQVDAGLPMAYVLTEKRDQAKAQVQESVRQWQAFKPGVPLIIGARGYSGDGYKFTQEAAEGTYEAASEAKDAGMAIGIIYWSSYHAIRYRTGEVLSQLPPWGPVIPDSQKHASDMATYGSSLEQWADENNTTELLLEEVRKLDETLRTNGYDGIQPPDLALQTAQVLGTIAWQQSGNIQIDAEKWYQRLNRFLIHMGQNARGIGRLSY